MISIEYRLCCIFSHNVAMSLKRLNRCKILDREMNSLSSKSELLIQMSVSINNEQAESVCTLHEFIYGDHKRIFRLILLAQCILQHGYTRVDGRALSEVNIRYTMLQHFCAFITYNLNSKRCFFIFYFLCVQIKVKVSLVHGTHKDMHYAAVCIIIIIIY